ncbi:PAS domain-containing hybrid sensor histidine kinase/response regulator [Roseovarius sp.]|uniref:PAS domain-containing hybrid sensor histidine kinase/response regulator n=1 Tax=Roseovarius sp. TaxID=1486281 RepID=UPI00260F3883|nr:PAS domain-containing hybrid sensor histidine kinase/response regulator [Roseovarius sp.]MDM8167799.1 ATP-binding protein [Roseovarius sp.]
MAQLRPKGMAIFGAALLFAAAGLLAGSGLARLTFVLTAVLLALAAIWILVAVRRNDRADRAAVHHAAELAGLDPVPVVLTGPDLVLLYANPAARAAFGGEGETTLTGMLDEEFANASAFLFSMEREVRTHGAALREADRPDGRLTVTVHSAGGERCLWRVHFEAAETARAVPGGDVPVIRLGSGDEMLCLNDAAQELLGSQDGVADMFRPQGPIRAGRVCTILTESGPTSRLVADWPREDGTRDVYLFPAMARAEEAANGWTFFEALPVPLLKLSRDGRLLLSNRPSRALLGIDSAEGRRLTDVVESPGRPLPDWLDDAAAGRGTVQAETVRVRREDREVFVQVVLAPAMDNGDLVLIAVLHDATKFKSLEAQFVQSQKMQAIGQLAGGVAHDFNNLLTAISGHCDLLLLRHEQDDGDYADLVQISQNANRAAALVSQLLAYSRKQTLRPRVIDLREVLSDLTHLLNRLVGEKITLEVTHDPELWAVRADKRQLEQVLMNLVVNARDAMPHGGNITITTDNRYLKEALRRDRAVVAPGRYVAVTVTDRGAGIAADHLDKIFEPFFTTKRPGDGTGLGLSTVYGIMKQTGGFIFVDSAPGEGTSFLMLFSAHEAPARVAAPVATRSLRDSKAEGVVLLVEDEAPVRAFASRALKMRGFTVLEADSAEAALNILEDESLRIDVFLTDVIMPGMDGPSWVRKALEARPHTQVIFISGYAPETFGESETEMPNSVFLPKPFSLTELTETVSAQVNGSGGRST